MNRIRAASLEFDHGVEELLNEDGTVCTCRSGTSRARCRVALGASMSRLDWVGSGLSSFMEATTGTFMCIRAGSPTIVPGLKSHTLIVSSSGREFLPCDSPRAGPNVDSSRALL